MVSGLFGSFEEKYWRWKIFLCLERAALAVLVHAAASSWFAVAVFGSCRLANLWCQPYLSRAEDFLDGMVRMTTFLTCLAAALVEAEVLEGDKVWLGAILSTVDIITLLALVIFIGPLRLMRGAIKSCKARRRAIFLRSMQIDKISEEAERSLLFMIERRLTLTLHFTHTTGANQMTEDEFNQFSPLIKVKLA